MQPNDPGSTQDRRLAQRVALTSSRPAYIQTWWNGAEAALLVENLSAGGATLICPERAELVGEGEQLPDSILVLPLGPRISVRPIVRWHIWPRIGVQFESIEEDSQQQITKFLRRVKLEDVNE
jgi:c-di-GMP-binding flagellar brake protein YcgR